MIDLTKLVTKADKDARAAATAKAAMDAVLATARAYREDVLNRLMGIAFAANVAGDNVTREGCLAARKALLDITKDARVVAATTEAELNLALKTRYAEIVAAAPAAVRNAFAAGNA